MGIKSFLGLMISVSFAVSCSQGHCRRKGDTGTVQSPSEVQSADARKSTESERILVYKYDGSLQCKLGKAINVEVMAKELKGIQIFSQSKKPDGLMHIQVCGSITGIANVYEISAKDLKKAESLGFKKWEMGR